MIVQLTSWEHFPGTSIILVEHKEQKFFLLWENITLVGIWCHNYLRLIELISKHRFYIFMYIVLQRFTLRNWQLLIRIIR